MGVSHYLEIVCLKNLVGVARTHGVRYEEVRRRAGIERELASGVYQRVLKWFLHVKRMYEYCMARRELIEGWRKEVKTEETSGIDSEKSACIY